MIFFFFWKIFDIVAQCNNQDIIIGGDFNCYLDPILDRSSNKVASPLKSVAFIYDFMKSLNFVYLEFQHPFDRKYNFFHPHMTRIGHFLIDSNLISRIMYDSILISDHVPLLTQIHFNLDAPLFNWKCITPQYKQIISRLYFKSISAKTSDFFV